MRRGTILGMNPFKVLFAMEYVLQGLANPFLGITYHSFFKHFHFTYGLTEAATQSYFSKAYLAWSFKPVIGFFMDAYGKTRTILIVLLLSGTMLYLLASFVNTSAQGFFWIMFVLSVFFAGTDVAVDRA
ncbi:MAG: folate/biopterin family MFS transporter, partial [Desulfobacterales bacterium]|nr:folate/biopterin family MFS transporter [Desulfobacterales bacterium]